MTVWRNAHSSPRRHPHGVRRGEPRCLFVRLGFERHRGRLPHHTARRHHVRVGHPHPRRHRRYHRRADHGGRPDRPDHTRRAPAGSPDGPASGSASPGAPDAPDTPAPPKPAPPADAGLPAKPGSDDTVRLVAALDAIDPAIVGGKPDQAVDRARNQCQSMYQFPKDRAKLVELANQRFTAPDHPQGFGTEKAEKILDALRATLCPPA